MRAVHQVVIAGADKTQATALAIEFWTSKGYTVHKDSYNCLVFWSHWYGSFRNMFRKFKIGRGEENPEYGEMSIELTMLCQTHPTEVKWELQYHVMGYEDKDGAFNQETRKWCNEFDVFCRRWMGNVDELATGQARAETT